MEVFCNDCKHCYISDGYKGATECWHPSNIVLSPTPFCKILELKDDIYKLNRHNKCKLYERIWYKFWIKEQK